MWHDLPHLVNYEQNFIKEPYYIRDSLKDVSTKQTIFSLWRMIAYFDQNYFVHQM